MSDLGDWSPVTHDVYLKIWQLALAGEHDGFGSNTRSVAADVILFEGKHLWLSLDMEAEGAHSSLHDRSVL